MILSKQTKCLCVCVLFFPKYCVSCTVFSEKFGVFVCLPVRISARIITFTQVVGFIWGYFCQQYIQAVYVLGAGVLLASLVS